MTNPSNIIKSLAQSKASHNVLEKPALVGDGSKRLHIGIPKVESFNENRIPLTPESVKVIVSRGNEVLIESGAGERAGFLDNAYSEAGAKIVYDKKEIYNAHVLVKMSPITEEEIELLHPNQFVFSPIHLPKMKQSIIDGLLKKKVISLAFEYIKDEVKNFPLVHALSEIAGRASILIAGQLMNTQSGGSGLLIGGVTGVKPTKVLVLGAGTVGESATRAALGLGAQVKLFDDNVYKLRRVQNHLNNRLYTSIIHPELLLEELKSADVVIGAIHAKTSRTPIIVTEDMIQQMKPSAVIIDISIDQGGVFETSEVTSIETPTFYKHGVLHYCVPNISSMYPKTASSAISNILMTLFNKASENGGFEHFLKVNKGFRKGVYTYKGKLTNEYLSQKFHHKFTDFELLMDSGYGS